VGERVKRGTFWRGQVHDGSNLGPLHSHHERVHPEPFALERVRRHLKEGLKARGAQTYWPQHLPWVLLNIRTAPKMDSNISAAEMVYGTALTLPAQPLSPEETPSVAVKQQGAGRAIPTRELPQQAPTEVPTHLATAEMVYVKKGGQAGPLAPTPSPGLPATTSAWPARERRWPARLDFE